MHGKKYLALFAISLIVIYGIVKIPFTNAQQSTPKDGEIPSDLALDLDLAQKNPTPEQKLISEVQTEKAQITTSQGRQEEIPIKEEIPEEIKNQSAQDAINPDQTTSEQVIEKKEVGPVEPNGANNNQDNGAIQNNIPGTNIAEPDDNSAPQPTPSTNPTVNTPSPSNGESNSIPLENGNTQAAPTSSDNPSTDNSSSQPSAGGDSSSGDSTGVQGVSTVSWWQIFLNQVSKVFKK